jgi:DNA polymerase
LIGMSRPPATSAADYLPERRTLPAMARAAQKCRGCELYKQATQAVFGEGPADARIMLVGEMPGDAEDLAGRVFVGAAGKLLDKALAEAGLDRAELYLTNAVKHFRFLATRGIRLHKTPKGPHIAACRPWLLAELEAVEPKVIVCLGATAARSVFGRALTIKSVRGTPQPHPSGARVVVAAHPAAVLRMPEREARHAAYAALVADLRLAKETAAG